MMTREELLLRKAWAFTAYKEGRIDESRYKTLTNQIDSQLNQKSNIDNQIMKKMFNKVRKEYSHS